MKVSFIIRFKNEKEFMQECVEAILAQKGIEKEIIFVNDNTTDSSLDYVKSLVAEKEKDFEAKLINLEPAEFTWARGINIALPEVTSDFICIISAHVTIINEDGILKMLDNFDDPLVAGVYCKTVSRPGANLVADSSKARIAPGYKIIRSLDFLNEKEQKNPSNYIFLNTCNLIRTEIFEKYPFHDLPSVEDMEWAYRVMKAGFKIVYEPQAKVYHSHNDPVKKLIKRWLTADVGINLVFHNRIPAKLALLKGPIISYALFMFKIALAERNLLRKVKYFLQIFYGIYIIKKEVLFNYEWYKAWKEKYERSKQL